MSAEINNLPEQNLEKLDVTKLDPFDIEVMSHQATINIGTIGHVAHGKSTVVRAISGIQTVRFKSELERNITIKLGYANAKIFKCDNAKCLRPDCYKSFKSSMNNMKPTCDQCNSTMTLQRHVSFVDCFGLDEEFLTTDGQVISNKDITIGTSLMGPDGCARIVEDITEGVKDMYKISYATKEGGFNCTGGHLLCLRVDEPCEATYFSNTANRYIVRYIKGNENEVTSHVTSFATIEEADDFYQTLDKSPLYCRLTVDAYLNMSQMFKSKARMYSAPVLPFNNHARTSLTIGDASEEEVAWVVGLWLGSGSVGISKFILSSADDEIIEKLANITMKMGASLNSSQSKDQSAMFVTLNNTSGENVFMQLLKKLGIVDNKRICDAIKFHSVEVRRALVAGFFDADGTLNNGQVNLEQSVTVQDQLFNDFIFVVRSLGFAANVSTHKTHITSINQDGDKIITPCNKLRVRFNADNTLPIASSHKRVTNSLRSSVTSQTFSVESLGDMPYKGFKVSGADQKVLLKDFLVVHNCPGHDILMATMLNGAAVMDAAFLLIAGNESCPQPQTSEHLAAVEIMKLKNIVILQNKIDLVMEREAASQYEEILNFVRGTVADGAPIIPISAQLRYNIEVILEYICTKIPKPIRDFTSSPRMIVIRSFDVNLPGEEVENLKGGVAGGSILRGVLRMGQEIEVRPGIVTRDAEGRVKCIPIFSKINSLFAEKNSLNYAVPGGLIGVGTKIDPTLTRADRLVGQVLGQVGELPEIFTELEISFFLLRRLLGVVADKAATNKKADRITKLIRGEVLMVNIGSTSTGARVLSVKGDLAKVVLTSPVCSSEGEKLALSRRVDKHWRLIGWGMIQKGRTIDEVDADEVEVEEN